MFSEPFIQNWRNRDSNKGIVSSTKNRDRIHDKTDVLELLDYEGMPGSEFVVHVRNVQTGHEKPMVLNDHTTKLKYGALRTIADNHNTWEISYNLNDEKKSQLAEKKQYWENQAKYAKFNPKHLLRDFLDHTNELKRTDPQQRPADE